MAKRKGGLPSRFMKMGGSLKSRWRKYKASLSGRKSGSTAKKATSNTTSKTVIIRRPATMAKAKSKPRAKSRPHFSTSKMGNVITNGAVIAGTMLVSTAGVNTLPVIKDLKSWQKSTSQAIIGLVLLFGFKNIWVKKLGAGAIAGGMFNAALPYLPNAFKMGKSRPLTQSEIAALTMSNNMGKPYSMGRPFTVQRTSQMGRPYTLAGDEEKTTMGRTSNRSGRF